MADSKKLVRRLRKIASELEKAANWNGSGLAVDATKDDYLYELDCYFRAALAANPQFSIRVSGKTETTTTGELKARWPKKPAHKQNYSYLSLCNAADQQEIFQLCPGIEITDKDGKARAPDINLLSACAPGNPTHANVLSIWDAKFTSKDGTKLPDTAVSDFVFTYQQFSSPNPPSKWLNNVTAVEWQRSGLLTNAQASTEPDSMFAYYGVFETSEFPEGPPKTRP